MGELRGLRRLVPPLKGLRGVFLCVCFGGFCCWLFGYELYSYSYVVLICYDSLHVICFVCVIVICFFVFLRLLLCDLFGLV